MICVTHGHFDHYVDVPAVQKETDAIVVSSYKVCNHLNAKYKVRSERLIALEPLQEIDVCGFRIIPFEWGHRDVRMSTFLKNGVLKAAFLPTIQFAWLNLVRAPFDAPYLGFHVVDASGIRLTNYCEGFNDTMDIEGIRELGRRLKTDVLIAGAQLNFEEHVAKGVAAMSPRTVVLFHPHEVLFERLGLKSAPAERFASAVRRVSPETEAIVAKPMSCYKMGAGH